MDLSAEQITAIITGILQIIGAFSVASAALPVPKSPALIVLRKIIDVCAANVGNAKNAKQP